MESGAETKLSSDQVARTCARSYRTRSGPPHSHRFHGLPASYFRLHKLHSRCVNELSGMRRCIYLIGLTVFALPLWAGEYVLLGNGFRLHADRHEICGDSVLIFSGDGVTEMPAAAITGYEPEESHAPLQPAMIQEPQ